MKLRKDFLTIVGFWDPTQDSSPDVSKMEKLLGFGGDGQCKGQ